MTAFEIRTCSDSLLKPGACCVCGVEAVVAVLTADMTEHARCERHGTGDRFLATKPLVWAAEWGPR